MTAPRIHTTIACALLALATAACAGAQSGEQPARESTDQPAPAVELKPAYSELQQARYRLTLIQEWSEIVEQSAKDFSDETTYTFTVTPADRETEAAHAIDVTIDHVFARKVAGKSELIFDSDDPQRERSFIAADFIPLIDLTIQLDLTETGVLAYIDVPQDNPYRESRAVRSFLRPEIVDDVFGPVFSLYLDDTAARPGDSWERTRTTALLRYQDLVASSTYTLLEPQGDVATMIIRGDLDNSPGADDGWVAQTDITGQAVWDTELGIMRDYAESVTASLSGVVNGRSFIQEIHKRTEATLLGATPADHDEAADTDD